MWVYVCKLCMILILMRQKTVNFHSVSSAWWEWRLRYRPLVFVSCLLCWNTVRDWAHFAFFHCCNFCSFSFLLSCIWAITSTYLFPKVFLCVWNNMHVSVEQIQMIMITVKIQEALEGKFPYFLVYFFWNCYKIFSPSLTWLLFYDSYKIVFPMHYYDSCMRHSGLPQYLTSPAGVEGLILNLCTWGLLLPLCTGTTKSDKCSGINASRATLGQWRMKGWK